LNVQDVYVNIFQSTATVPGFPADAGLLYDKSPGLRDKIKDRFVYTYIRMHRELSCYNTRPHAITWLNNKLFSVFKHSVLKIVFQMIICYLISSQV